MGSWQENASASRVYIIYCIASIFKPILVATHHQQCCPCAFTVVKCLISTSLNLCLHWAAFSSVFFPMEDNKIKGGELSETTKVCLVYWGWEKKATICRHLSLMKGDFWIRLPGCWPDFAVPAAVLSSSAAGSPSDYSDRSSAPALIRKILLQKLNFCWFFKVSVYSNHFTISKWCSPKHLIHVRGATICKKVSK